MLCKYCLRIILFCHRKIPDIIKNKYLSTYNLHLIFDWILILKQDQPNKSSFLLLSLLPFDPQTTCAILPKVFEAIKSCVKFSGISFSHNENSRRSPHSPQFHRAFTLTFNKRNWLETRIGLDASATVASWYAFLTRSYGLEKRDLLTQMLRFFEQCSDTVT